MRLFSLVFVLLGSTAFADSFFVETITGNEITAGDKSAVEELVRISVTENGKHTVVSKKDKADWILAPALLKLGDSYIITLQKKDKKDQVVFAEKMKAKTMSDMDTVASRLTRSVIEQKRTSETADVTNITQEEETMNTRRYQATRQWIIGIGPGWSNNLNSAGGGFTFTLGYLWGLDPDFAINLSWKGNNGRKEDDSGYSTFSLGGEYYISRTKTSPFVGGRIGYGSAHADTCPFFSATTCSEDKATGWSVDLDAGYKFFRTSSVNAGVAASYSYIFDETTRGNPSLFSVNLLVYY